MKLTLLALGFGVYLAVLLLRYDAVRYRYEVGDRVRITSSLSEEPQIYEDKQRLKIAGIAIYLNRFPEYHYFDELVVEGVVEKGKSGYFLKDAKVVGGSDEVVGKIKEQKNFLLNFRQKVLASFGKFLPPPESTLIMGLVLGTKNSLDLEFFNQLRQTGTLHTVVASGTNVSLFAGSLIAVLSVYLNRRRSLVVGVLVVWVYVFLVGGQPPIVRAALFATIAYFGQMFGREAGVIRILGVVGGIMLLLNPLWIFDTGFQLSFAATLGILLFGEKLVKILKEIKFFEFLPKIFQADLASTLSAQIFVTPIIFFTFGQVSLISPLVNMLVLWTVPILMLGGVVMGIVGVLWEPLGQAIAWLIYPLLWYFVAIVQLFAGLAS